MVLSKMNRPENRQGAKNAKNHDFKSNQGRLLAKDFFLALPPAGSPSRSGPKPWSFFKSRREETPGFDWRSLTVFAPWRFS